MCQHSVLFDDMILVFDGNTRSFHHGSGFSSQCVENLQAGEAVSGLPLVKSKTDGRNHSVCETTDTTPTTKHSQQNTLFDNATLENDKAADRRTWCHCEIPQGMSILSIMRLQLLTVWQDALLPTYDSQGLNKPINTLNGSKK